MNSLTADQLSTLHELNRLTPLPPIRFQGLTRDDLVAQVNEAIRIAADHFRSGRLKSALAAYEDLVDHPLAPVQTHYDHAVVLRALGRHQEALKPLTRYLAIYRHDFKAWTNAGDSLRELGKHKAALAMFRHALTLAPTTAEATKNTAGAHYNVSRELMGAGAMADALDHAQRAAALDPSDPEIVMGLGELQLMTGDYANGWMNYEARHEKAIADAKHSP